ncbi:MAG: hypothetical protein DMG81_14955 [Acidobacteria bacterium]|nr:MAG: hypothetical protein DMG81_14955 [Acidobacteriota bacterium]
MGGMLSQIAENVVSGEQERPQRLKPRRFDKLYGSTESSPSQHIFLVTFFRNLFKHSEKLYQQVRL